MAAGIEAPMCKLCKTRHWLREPHIHPKIAALPRAERRAERRDVSRETSFDWDARKKELGLK